MLTNYFNWRVKLRDGSEVSQFENGVERSMFVPVLNVAEIILEGENGFTVPVDGLPVYFRRVWSQTGVDFNAQYPGLWYIATSLPTRKRLAEFDRDYLGDDKEGARATFIESLASRPLASRIMEQVSLGEIRSLDEMFLMHFYCVGSFRDGVANVVWCSPLGATLEARYHGATYNKGIINIANPELMGETVRQLGELYHERISSRVEMAKEELDNFVAVFKQLSEIQL